MTTPGVNDSAVNSPGTANFLVAAASYALASALVVMADANTASVNSSRGFAQATATFNATVLKRASFRATAGVNSSTRENLSLAGRVFASSSATGAALVRRDVTSSTAAVAGAYGYAIPNAVLGQSYGLASVTPTIVGTKIQYSPTYGAAGAAIAAGTVRIPQGVNFSVVDGPMFGSVAPGDASFDGLVTRYAGFRVSAKVFKGRAEADVAAPGQTVFVRDGFVFDGQAQATGRVDDNLTTVYVTFGPSGTASSYGVVVPYIMQPGASRDSATATLLAPGTKLLIAQAAGYASVTSTLDIRNITNGNRATGYSTATGLAAANTNFAASASAYTSASGSANTLQNFAGRVYATSTATGRAATADFRTASVSGLSRAYGSATESAEVVGFSSGYATAAGMARVTTVFAGASYAQAAASATILASVKPPVLAYAVGGATATARNPETANFFRVLSDGRSLASGSAQPNTNSRVRATGAGLASGSAAGSQNYASAASGSSTASALSMAEIRFPIRPDFFASSTAYGSAVGGQNINAESAGYSTATGTADGITNPNALAPNARAFYVQAQDREFTVAQQERVFEVTA